MGLSLGSALKSITGIGGGNGGGGDSTPTTSVSSGTTISVTPQTNVTVNNNIDTSPISQAYKTLESQSQLITQALANSQKTQELSAQQATALETKFSEKFDSSMKYVIILSGIGIVLFLIKRK